MSNKKEVTVDVSSFGDSLDGFKFFVQQIEYRCENILQRPVVHLQVLGVVDTNPSGLPPRDVLQAEFEKTMSAAKNGDEHAMKRLLPLAEACMRVDKACGLTPSEQEIIGALNGERAKHGAVFQENRNDVVVDERQNASIYGRAVKAPVPEGVSIHHDLERRFTIAYSISKSGRLAFVGIAYCSPHDQFCRRTGRELAISRLDERPCRVVKLPRVMAPGTDDYPKNGAEWRAVEQSILLGLGLLR